MAQAVRAAVADNRVLPVYVVTGNLRCDGCRTEGDWQTGFHMDDSRGICVTITQISCHYIMSQNNNAFQVEIHRCQWICASSAFKNALSVNSLILMRAHSFDLRA